MTWIYYEYVGCDNDNAEFLHIKERSQDRTIEEWNTKHELNNRFLHKKSSLSEKYYLKCLRLSLCHAHVINCVLFLHVSVSPFLSHFSITGLCFPVSLMNCVKEVHWVAVGTPLRGVSMTLSPGAGNNRRNQLLWESA